MDLQIFYKALKKRKWLVIIPMFMTAVVAYYFISKQQIKTLAKENTTYKSQTSVKNILAKRLVEEVKLKDAKKAKSSIQFEMDRLKISIGEKVSDENYIQNLKQRIEIADKNYQSILDKMNQAKTKKRKTSLTFQIVDSADKPTQPVHNYKLLKSGFASIIAALWIIVFLFLFDFKFSKKTI